MADTKKTEIYNSCQFSIFFHENRPFWIFFCFIPIQISHNLCVSKDGTKFWWLPWFPAKSSEIIAIVSHCSRVELSTYTVEKKLRTSKQKFNFCKMVLVLRYGIRFIFHWLNKTWLGNLPKMKKKINIRIS